MKAFAKCTGLLLVVVGISGCVIPPPKPKQPEATHVTLRYTVPTLTAITEQGKSETIDRDGVRVTAAAHRYEAAAPTMQLEFKRVGLVIEPQNNLVDIRETPWKVEAQPKEIRLKIRIANKLNRIVRLSGAVVQWKVAGKAVAVSKTGSEQFLGGIILPRGEQEFDIIGPEWESLPSKTTVALLIYDVVTQTDAAGNPTKRSNFEFYYQLDRQDKEGSFPITKKRGSVSSQSAKLLPNPVSDEWVRCTRWDGSPVLHPVEYCSQRK